MKKVQFTNWKLEGDKIIFTGLIDGEEVEAELPNEILKEIYVEGPPSQEKTIREGIEKINNIRVDELLTIEDIAKKIDAAVKDYDAIMKEFDQASDKIKVLALSGKVRAIQGKKASFDALRHLSRLLYQEEGKLRAELLKLQRSSE